MSARAPATWRVQRGLLAFLVWLVLLAGYTVAIVTAHQTIQTPMGASVGGAFWIGITAAVVGISFPTLQRLGRTELERRVALDIYGYAEILRQMTHEIARLSGTDAVALGTLARLGHTLDLAWASIIVRDGDSPQPRMYCWGAAPPQVDQAVVLQHFTTLHRQSRPRALRVVSTTSGAWLVPLAAEQSPIGALLVGPKRRGPRLSSNDLSLVIAVAPVLGVALENGTLMRRLQTHIDDLASREHELAALSARLLQVQEEERHRLALDLHDDPLQRAIFLARELRDASDEGIHTRWRRSAEEIADSLRAISTGLRPAVLDDLGLVPALERLIREVQIRADVEASLAVTPNDCRVHRLPLDLEVALYRVAQEALNNCVKHAAANAIDVSFEVGADVVRLLVSDNGCGYAPLPHDDDDMVETFGVGLFGMRERLRPWQGRLDIRTRDSGGTEVLAEVRLQEAAP